eukprot:707369-Prymnesium_polylepis.1
MATPLLPNMATPPLPNMTGAEAEQASARVAALEFEAQLAANAKAHAADFERELRAARERKKATAAPPTRAHTPPQPLPNRGPPVLRP